jgi:hypothetical protein
MTMKTIFTFLLGASLLPAISCGSVHVVGSLARSNNVQPGGKFEGVIVVKNSGSEAVPVKVRQADYSYQADGSNNYGEPGGTPRSNAGWITLSPSQFTVAAGQSAAIHYRGRVPAGGDLRGSYWSMIMVEPEGGALAPTDPGKKEIGLRPVVRFGVQIVTEIGRGAQPRLRVADKKLLGEAGRQRLQLDLENAGERLMIPSISVELYDARGASAGKFELGRQRIYPSCSIRASADFSSVPAGKYTAMLLVDTGDDQIMGAQYALELGAPLAVAPALRPPTALASPVASDPAQASPSF